MRYRRLDANGDYVFGAGQGSFWINQPEAVGQYVMTRLRLNWGEWFANINDGTPWATQVLGERTQATRDLVVQSRVLDTPGVTDIAAYYSQFNPNTRTFAALLTIDTAYGGVTLTTTGLPTVLPTVPPPGAALVLGIQGTAVTQPQPPGTQVSMVPANLTVGPQATIADFAIVRVDPGPYS